MLVVGSFWGRAGGLIALGVVAALATAARHGQQQLPRRPLQLRADHAGEVRDAYDFGGGEFTLDLSGVSDVDALDGRDITIDGVGGQVEVVVPDGDGRRPSGPRSSPATAGCSTSAATASTSPSTGFRDGGDEVPDMSITIDLVAGEVIVREAA